MNPQLKDRLGQKGYTTVVRAPRCDIAQLSDGSWHVIGGSMPSRPDEFHQVDESLIPYLIGMGGDIIVYKLPQDADEEARPVFSKGGMDGRPPSLRSVTPYDPGLVTDIRGLRDAKERRDREAQRAQVKVAQPRRLDRRACAIATAAMVALVAGGGAWEYMRPAQPGGRHPDLSDPEVIAMRKGAYTVIQASDGNPETIDLFRVYPSPDGSVRRDYIGSVLKKDWESYGRELPPSRIQWRKNWNGARMGD